jgi:hypothetical protein
MRELCDHLGWYLAKQIDAEAEKRAGWLRLGTSAAAEQRPHLSRPACELVGRLGTERSGRRGAAPNG